MLLRVWEAAAKLWRKEHEKKNLNLNFGARAAARVMSRMPRRARRKGDHCSKLIRVCFCRGRLMKLTSDNMTLGMVYIWGWEKL